MSDPISIAGARRRILDAVAPLGGEDVSLGSALGRVLAEDVASPIDVPPFDSSAMDGYAVVAGAEAELEVVGEARAGHPFPGGVAPGQAVRISTGAVVPEGADAVVPVERTTASKGGDSGDLGALSGDIHRKPHQGWVRVPEIGPGANIRRAGEDISFDAVVLRAGAQLGPAELGAAASVGRASLRVAQRPRVAVLLTGDELTPPGAPLPPGGIYSSNGFALTALVERAGATLTARADVPDDPEGTRDAIGAALEDADVTVVSGGVSVGPHDHVKGAFAALGVEEVFWRVSLRPGMPTWFGARDGTLAFGLPGNPVSAMVTFQLFVKPALAALQGAAPEAQRVTALLGAAVPRNPRREQAVRIRLETKDDRLLASPTGPQGSHMMTSMLGADGLAMIAPGPGTAEAGERVDVELL